MTPFISICIPAYKRVHYLQRLLDSIGFQSYKNFEVVITDDSPDDQVEKLVHSYLQTLPVKYFRNEKSLGTPENWNEAIRQSSGDWIKIMHDDDWFADKNSLQKFADAIAANEDKSFFFSAYVIIHEQENNRKEIIRLSRTDENKLKGSSLYLFRKNYIGNPSCTLFRKDPAIVFDNRFQWVVDFEFYIRFLNRYKNDFVYINDTLVNISVNQSQVTKSAFRAGTIEIPENHILIVEAGFNKLKNIYVYDHFWRLYRNLGIRNIAQINEFGYAGQLHPVLASMINWQKKIPRSTLKFGPVSKTLMGLHYFTHISKLK